MPSKCADIICLLMMVDGPMDVATAPSDSNLSKFADDAIRFSPKDANAAQHGEEMALMSI